MHYTYNVTISAPNDFAAAAFIGSLHESADQWRRLKTPIHVLSIDVDNSDLTHEWDIGDDVAEDLAANRPPIDTIPLF